jgi:hypothetical protein
MFRIFCTSLLALTVFAATPAFAADRITEDAIRTYYREAAAAFRLPYDQYVAKADSMMANSYRSTAHITFMIPGTKPARRTETMTKEQARKIANQTYNAMKPATIAYTVEKMTISPDGKSAVVNDTINVTGMSMGAVPMTMSTSGSCNEKLELDARGVLQVVLSECTLTTSMLPKLR